MGLIITIIVITLISLLIGYTISTTTYFFKSRKFRITTYFLILILLWFINKMIFENYNLKKIFGTITGCQLFWFYFGTLLNNKNIQKLKFKKFKNVLGKIETVVGIITLIFFAYRIFTENTPIKLFFIHFFIGISQLIFGYSLIKSSQKNIINYEKN